MIWYKFYYQCDSANERNKWNKHSISTDLCRGRVGLFLPSPGSHTGAPSSKYSRWRLEPTRLLDRSNEPILYLVTSVKGLITIWVQHV